MSKSSELIYTSAPQGLRPGSRGFCTVVMSENMPAGLVGPLESLSAYRNLSDDGPAPVNSMHVQITVAGRPVGVLSRVANAPPDYTGRTNKIAHHVVVASTDRAAGGPAAVLRHPGFTIQAWDGEVRKIPQPKSIPPVDSSLRIAETWAEQVGDAGWAGYVASILENKASGPPTFMLYRRDQTDCLLQLIDEAICLLPEAKRWNATFSTYTDELPPGVVCRLRCLLAGSAEASAIPPSATRIDLTHGNLGAPPPGPYVDAARSGEVVMPEPASHTATPASPTPSDPSMSEAASQPLASSFDDPFTLAPPPPDSSKFGAPPPPLGKATDSRRRNVWLPLAATALVLLCVGSAAAFYFLQSRSDDLLAELNASAGIPAKPKITISTDAESQMAPEPEDTPEESTEDKPMAEEQAEAARLEAERLEQEKQATQSLPDRYNPPL